MGKYFIKEKKAHFYVYCIIRQVQSIRHVRSSCSDVLPQGGQGKGVSLVYVITFGRSGFINSVLPQNINILSFDHPDITKWFKPLNKDVGSRMVRIIGRRENKQKKRKLCHINLSYALKFRNE